MRSEFGVETVRERDGKKIVIVDTNKARYKDLPFKSLGGFGRRKFENLIALSNAKDRIKIIYK